MARRSSGSLNAPLDLVNPHAERVTPEEIEHLITTYYGTKVLWVGKDMAEKLLEHNTGNRTISRRKLERLIAQMTNGDYENTGEPIILSSEGVLNDGQHRLMALIAADIEVDMDVRFGIARRVFSKTNTGSSRNSGDVLAIRGVVGGTAVASAVRLLILYRRGLPGSVRDFVSNSEVDEAFQRWRTIELTGRQLAGYAFPKGVRSTPLLATAYLASRSPAKDKLAQWLEILATGLTTGKTDPAYVLRERLMRGVEQAVGTRESMIERFALMIMSWNAVAFGQGMTAKDLRWNQTGKTPMPFPKVEGVRL